MEAEGLRRLASRTSVLATTVGPFTRYGREVVRAVRAVRAARGAPTTPNAPARCSSPVDSGRDRPSGAGDGGQDRALVRLRLDPLRLGVLLKAGRAAAGGQGTLEETALVVAIDEGRNLRSPSTPSATGEMAGHAVVSVTRKETPMTESTIEPADEAPDDRSPRRRSRPMTSPARMRHATAGSYAKLGTSVTSSGDAWRRCNAERLSGCRPGC